MDESGAVDAVAGHPAPEVRRAEVRAGLVDGVTVGTRLREPCPRDCPRVLSQRGLADPAGVVVRGADAGPAVSALFHSQWLAAQRLRDLFGRGVRFCMN